MGKPCLKEFTGDCHDVKLMVKIIDFEFDCSSEQDFVR